jgi:hypothetical protein
MKIPIQYEYELKFCTVHCLSSSYYVMFLQLNSVVTLTVFPSRLLPALPCKVPAEGLKKCVCKQVIKGLNILILIRIGLIYLPNMGGTNEPPCTPSSTGTDSLHTAWRAGWSLTFLALNPKKLLQYFYFM